MKNFKIVSIICSNVSIHKIYSYIPASNFTYETLMITKGNFVSLCSVVTEVYGIHYCFKLARYMMKEKKH